MIVRNVPAVLGGADLVAKMSAVDKQGELRNLPVEGVSFRATRPVPHEDGHVAEVARTDWPVMGGPILQVHITTTLPGRIRAWGLHQRSTDRLFVAEGLVKIAVFDGREGSATFGRLNVFTVSPKNPGLLVIEPNLYHGWKNVGTSEAIIINMPTSMYDHDAPDALDLPWDSELARRIIPFQF
jgi:dTDP-4-dehydrorhamnose 3,5-epimerase